MLHVLQTPFTQGVPLEQEPLQHTPFTQVVPAEQALPPQVLVPQPSSGQAWPPAGGTLQVGEQREATQAPFTHWAPPEQGHLSPQPVSDESQLSPLQFVAQQVPPCSDVAPRHLAPQAVPGWSQVPSQPSGPQL